MPRYECQVRNAKGDILKTQLEADNLQKLSGLLADKGFSLVKATEVRGGGGFSFGGSVSAKEMMVFTVQFSTMIEAQIPIVESIGILADQTENVYFKNIIHAIGKDLQSGNNLSVALKKHPKVFTRIYINMVEAGEAGGILDQVLKKLAAFSEADMAMRGKIKGALTLPVVQGVLATACVVFLLVKIFPNFTKMFKKMKAELPGITKALIAMSDFLREQYIAAMGITGGVIGGLWAFSKTEIGENIIAYLSVQAPIVGPLNKKIAIGRFGRTFSALQAAGVPILESLKITGSVMGNKALEAIIIKMSTGVQQGKGMTASIKGETLFPTMVVKMMEVGENTGNLPKMLEKIADFYDQETAEALDGLTAAITPIMTVGMGIVIGTIALSVFMPLFSMCQNMK